MSASMHPIDEFAARAERSMSAAAWAYLEGGAVDELSAARNPERYAETALVPRVCVDVSGLDMSCRILGASLPFPILLAPAALQRLFAEEGEMGTVIGAKAAGTIPVISMESSIATPELAQAGGPFWQHVYVQRDRELTLDLVRMAEAAGAGAIVVTLDNPVPGIRYRQDAGMLGLPEGIGRANLEAGGVPRLTGGYLDASMTWRDIEWLVSHTRLPVVGKGVLHPDDAEAGRDAGLAAVIVSNHGGRNLDTVAHTLDCLPAVSERLAGSIPVLLDGGIRRGTDVLKALALGADAVLVGRPYVWGLAADGHRGVTRVIEVLRDELAAAMAMCGLPSLAAIDRSVILPNGMNRRGGQR